MKRCFLLFLICLSGLQSHAQTDTLLSRVGTPVQNKLTVKPSPYSHAIGIRLGMVRTYVEDATSKNGFLFGIYYRFNICKWYIEPSVNLASYQIKSNDDLYDFLTVDIPVVVGRDIFRSKNFRVQIYAGPVITIPHNDDGEDDEDEFIVPAFQKAASTARINLKTGVGLDIGELITIHTEYTRIFRYYDSHTPANVLGVTFDINIIRLQKIFRDMFQD